jgi:hypothetical protein
VHVHLPGYDSVIVSCTTNINQFEDQGPSADVNPCPITTKFGCKDGHRLCMYISIRITEHIHTTSAHTHAPFRANSVHWNITWLKQTSGQIAIPGRNTTPPSIPPVLRTIWQAFSNCYSYVQYYVCSLPNCMLGLWFVNLGDWD